MLIDRDNKAPQIGGKSRKPSALDNSPFLGGKRKAEYEKYRSQIPIMIRMVHLYNDLNNFESGIDIEAHFDKSYQLILQSFTMSFASFAPNTLVNEKNRKRLIASYANRFFGLKPTKATISTERTYLWREEQISTDILNLETKAELSPYYGHVTHKRMRITRTHDGQVMQSSQFSVDQYSPNSTPIVEFSMSNEAWSLNRRFKLDQNGTLIRVGQYEHVE